MIFIDNQVYRCYLFINSQYRQDFAGREQEVFVYDTYIDFLGLSFRKEKAENVIHVEKKKESRRNLRGLLPGNVMMSEDFNETPDCFEEYM